MSTDLYVAIVVGVAASMTIACAVVVMVAVATYLRAESRKRKARAAMSAASVRYIRSTSHDLTLLPLSQSPVAQRIREQIADNECRRFRAELDRWEA